MKTIHNKQSGFFLVLILVFGSIFFVMITAFMGYVIQQKVVQTAKHNQEKALAVAEAGLNYYKWYLAHNPNDVTHGTSSPQPYVIEYSDPEADAIGAYELEVNGNQACGEVVSVDIKSTGYTYADTERTRVLQARYARPTVSEYAYIINSNVWAGEDRTIIGPYHSNGGIRMDGANNSTVSSGVEDWTCTESFGCGYSQTVDGVFGDGPDSDLWTYPSPPINFVGITVDISNMKAKAQGVNRYFGPSGDYGYLVNFLSNNTFDLYKVTGTRSYQGYTTEDGWQYERNVITNTSSVGNYSVPNDCSLIFIEDKVWVQGQVSDKVTLAAAEINGFGEGPSVIINDSITYNGDDAGLLVIGQEDVLIGVDVPNNMEVYGIYIAQNGRFGRNHYCTGDCDPYHSGNEGLPSSLDTYVKRNSLTMHGTIVSNGRVGTKWTSGGVWTSGFNTRYNSYDRDLVDDPPPLTPEVSDTYEFIEWREGL